MPIERARVIRRMIHVAYVCPVTLTPRFQYQWLVIAILMNCVASQVPQEPARHAGDSGRAALRGTTPAHTQLVGAHLLVSSLLLRRLLSVCPAFPLVSSAFNLVPEGRHIHCVRVCVCEGGRAEGARALPRAVRATRAGQQLRGSARAARRRLAAVHPLHGHACRAHPPHHHISPSAYHISTIQSSVCVRLLGYNRCLWADCSYSSVRLRDLRRRVPAGPRVFARGLRLRHLLE